MIDEYLTLHVTRTKFAQWTIRVSIPESPDTDSAILLLHGWTGDENSMSIFSSRLPGNKILIMPRGIYKAYEGYSWYPRLNTKWPTMDDFNEAVEALDELLVKDHFPIEMINCDCLGKISLIGFSQGAALAYAFSLAQPDRVKMIAGLSGFLPFGYNLENSTNQFKGKPIFIAHGTKDNIVPIEFARSAVDFFTEVEGRVTFCVDDVGHKLSSGCFRGLQSFYQKY